jgi:uncharacterized membrane protein
MLFEREPHAPDPDRTAWFTLAIAIVGLASMLVALIITVNKASH